MQSDCRAMDNAIDRVERASATRARHARGARRLGVLVLLLGGCALGASACGGASSTAQAQISGGGSGGTPSTPVASASVSATPSGPSATDTPLPVASKAPSQAGAADICAESASIQATPPSTLPSYSGATLHISLKDGSSFSYCSNDSVTVIAGFYAQQLPANGWTNVTSYANDPLQQFTAVQGSTHLTVTIEPSNSTQAQTDIIVTEHN